MNKVLTSTTNFDILVLCTDLKIRLDSASIVQK